eukprot:4535807-Pyramimonas_sp.AAC.1
MDMRQFGTPFKKPTSCTGKSGICSSTGLPHLILQGRDKGAPARRTELAAAYSPQFARAAARALIHSANALKEDWMMKAALEIV